jgi:AcrR family transcriptional regulator
METEANWYESRNFREKGKLKRAILETARNIAINEGFEAVTIRRIASAIEYGPPAIYALFENKEAIFNDLIHSEFWQLLEIMKNAYNMEMEPEERLLRLARSYWTFAENCPHMFNAMHGLATPQISSTAKPEGIKYLQELVSDVLVDYFKPRQLSPEQLDDMVQLLRGTMQGLISIGLSGRIQGGQERIIALIERAVKDFLQAWRQNLGVNRDGVDPEQPLSFGS